MARRYGIGTGLPEIAPQQDENQFKLLNPLYQAVNGLAKTVSDALGLTYIEKSDIQNSSPLIEYSGDLGRKLNLEAAEEILPYRLIWLDSSAGETKMWYASSQVGINRAAMGICVESTATATGERGRVLLFSGLLTGISGVVPGTIYWLGINGQFSAAMPTAPGWSQQKVGIGINSTSIMVDLIL